MPDLLFHITSTTTDYTGRRHTFYLFMWSQSNLFRARCLTLEGHWPFLASKRNLLKSPMASDSTLSSLFPTPGLAPSVLSPNSISRCLTRIFVCTSDCIEGQPCQMAHILNEQRFHKYISFSRTFVYREVLKFSHELVQLEVTLPRNCRLGPWCQWISDPCRVQQRYQLRKTCFQVFRRDNGAEFQWTSRRWQLVIDK